MSYPRSTLMHRAASCSPMLNDSQQMTTGSGDKADVDVIIVNYNTPSLTIEAAKSVLDAPNLRQVIIVDNASGDGSAEDFKRVFAGAAERVHIVESERNLGFGGGNNLGARSAGSEYLFLLNSDAVANPGCIAALHDILKKHSDIGLVAPSVRLADTGDLQPGTHGVFPTPRALLTRQTTASRADDLEPDWISGVAFLARRAEFEALGGFDESLFMYYEDVDLCRRYRLRGLKVAREPKVTVVHKLGQSGIGNPRHKTVYYESQDRYLRLAGYSPLARFALAGARGIFNMPSLLKSLTSRKRGGK